MLWLAVFELFIVGVLTPIYVTSCTRGAYQHGVLPDPFFVYGSVAGAVIFGSLPAILLAWGVSYMAKDDPPYVLKMGWRTLIGICALSIVIAPKLYHSVGL